MATASRQPSGDRPATRAVGEPLLVVVSGAPGTGKTTMGRRLAADLRIPYLGKDLIKESLFDSLGTKDREWSAKLGIASIELLFKLVESHLEAHQSLVAEMNFRKELEPGQVELLRKKYRFKAVEVHRKTDGQVLCSRLKQRGGSSERHPGHADAEMLEEIGEALRDGVFGPLALGGAVFEVDTTAFERVDYEATISAVRMTGGLCRP